MTNLYDKYILPKVTNFLCATGPAMKQRQKVVPLASGRVLEIGVGTGLNFSFYDHEKVKQVLALDPSEEMWGLAKNRLDDVHLDVDFIKGYAENIPLDANSVDSIVITYTLCTIPDHAAAMKEFKRVLKPSGNIIFSEHGIAPDRSVRKWQNRLNPIWKRLGGGCNLNRDIPAIIEHGGFAFDNLETMYIPGFKPASYNYWGTARPLIVG